MFSHIEIRSYLSILYKKFHYHLSMYNKESENYTYFNTFYPQLSRKSKIL